MIAQTIFLKGTTDSVFTYVDNQNILKEFKLYQNYPNPFNPTTTIQYSIPEAGIVSLKVFNILGEEINTLVDNYKEVGNYKVSFDGGALSSGIYFYRLTNGNFIQTNKMVLIK
jgi:hypothetical protein